jgi:hypothetical protein
MQRMHWVLVVGLLVSAGACKRGEEAQTAPATPPVAAPTAPAPAASFSVSSIDLGSSIGADKRVTASATTFAASDVIYAAVATQGAAPSVVLTARWTYEDGQVVSESSETIAPTGAAVTTFQIQHPSGWPTGKYRVDVAANGQPAGSREFEVR